MDKTFTTMSHDKKKLCLEQILADDLGIMVGNALKTIAPLAANYLWSRVK